MSLEETNQISRPLIQPPEQKMEEKKSCGECIGKMMDCCLPFAFIFILLQM